VVLFEGSNKLGGQLNLASAAPGKDEFDETLRYFKTKMKKNSVAVKLNTRPEVDNLVALIPR